METGEAATGCGSMDVHFVFSGAICCLFLVSGLAFDIPAPGPGAHHQSHGTGRGWGRGGCHTHLPTKPQTLDVSEDLEKEEGGLG